jgi:hypothetical protein
MHDRCEGGLARAIERAAMYSLAPARSAGDCVARITVAVIDLVSLAL